MPANLHLAARRLQQPGEQFDGGRLAGPVRAQQGKQPPPPTVSVNPSTATFRAYVRLTSWNSIMLPALGRVVHHPPERALGPGQFRGSAVRQTFKGDRCIEKRELLAHHGAVALRTQSWPRGGWLWSTPLSASLR